MPAGALMCSNSREWDTCPFALLLRHCPGQFLEGYVALLGGVWKLQCLGQSPWEVWQQHAQLCIFPTVNPFEEYVSWCRVIEFTCNIGYRFPRPREPTQPSSTYSSHQVHRTVLTALPCSIHQGDMSHCWPVLEDCNALVNPLERYVPISVVVIYCTDSSNPMEEYVSWCYVLSPDIGSNFIWLGKVIRFASNFDGLPLKTPW